MDETTKQNKHSTRKDHSQSLRERNENDLFLLKVLVGLNYSVDEEINSKVELYFGNFLDIQGYDVMVNAANGENIRKEAIKNYPVNKQGGRINTGFAAITGAYNLKNFKKIVHTVGPYLDKEGNPQENLLSSCYLESIKFLDGKKLSSIVFPCLSTGFYGFPMSHACFVALSTIRNVLENIKYKKKIHKVCFCVFNDLEQQFYKYIFPFVFPSRKN
ncbi:poly [adp-ribose] polymerase [Anaeramoeba flamelloides]|uniref:Poly [adp-ribose] polymerase n=1 Tax=Anaeramoeba flamelloides TaxID=1746091 RepID=A0AAV7YF27_9EUKA|nr:poly [adp-ribose] polymerase [Anaeramoeba flamelloides]KAJ6242772.1 poly [adp-ribose] polymerase [Anaeramoeba flamelloides]